MPLAVLRAVHPFPSVLVAVLTVALIPLADSDAPASLYVRLGVVMLLFQFAIGLTNDIVDVEEDRAAKPWKPIASGALSRPGATLMAASCAVGGLALSLALPPAAVLVGALGLGSGLAYDLWFKRTAFSWLPYSIALPLVPVWVYLAADAWGPVLWWSFPLGATLGLALHLANEVPDVERPGASGLPAQLGARRSRWLAVGLFALVALVVTLLAAREDVGEAAIVALVGAGVTSATPFARALGRDGLFGLLAVGSAVLALLFLRAS